MHQRDIDRIYSTFDAQVERYRGLLHEVEARGGGGTPQNRLERDVLAEYYNSQLQRLAAIEQRLVFGRLDMNDGEVRYIGRTGLTDAAGEQLLIDWRAPSAVPFYQATASHPMNVRRRRHILLAGRRVRSVDDELLDASGNDDLDIQGSGALLAALNRGRSSHMADIVATIQGEQDRIIRSDARQLLIVQGGPGTGKTAVALHRGAYLLYSRAEALAKSGVLVVGPSRDFLRYIEQVLPALGETGVTSTTLPGLIPGYRFNRIADTDERDLKGRASWARICSRAVESLVRPPQSDLVFTVNRVQLRISVEQACSAIDYAQARGGSHNERRGVFVSQILSLLVREYLGEAYTDEESTPSETSWISEDIRENIEVRRALNLIWLPVTPERLLRRMLRYPRYLADLTNDFSDTDLESLHALADAELSDADVPLIDELSELLGDLYSNEKARDENADARRREAELIRAQEAIDEMDLGGGIVSAEMIAAHALDGTQRDERYGTAALTDRSHVFGHVIVDEAQELTPMSWRMLLRRCPSRSMTVVGDIAQRRGEMLPWIELLGPARRALSEITELSVCYRTPGAIMRAAERVLRASGRVSPYPVRAIRERPEAIEVIKADAGRLGEQVRAAYTSELVLLGAGTKDSKDANEIHGSVGVVNGSGIELPVPSLIPSQVKGLEYDCVILVKPEEIGDLGDLYVAMTRATQRLIAITGDPDGETMRFFTSDRS